MVMRQNTPFNPRLVEEDEAYMPELRRVRPSLARPDVRTRLHAICALYAHSPNAKARTDLLDKLEELTLQAAMMLAVDLLENGWQGCDGL